MLPHELLPEQHPGHVHAILGTRLLGNGAEERLVAVAHMQIQHVQMALGYRHVTGFTDHQPRVMYGGQTAGDLDQVLQILQRSVTPAALEIPDERRAVYACEDLIVTADLDAFLRVARDLRELRRNGSAQLPCHTPLEPDTGSLHVGAGRLPYPQGFRVSPELDPDLLHQPVRLVFQYNQPLLMQKFVVGNPAPDECGGGRADTLPACRPTGTPGLSSCAVCIHLFTSPDRHVAGYLPHGNTIISEINPGSGQFYPVGGTVHNLLEVEIRL